jgi:hypothetical protein
MSLNNNNTTSHNDSRNSRTENLYRDLAELYQLEQQDRQVEHYDFFSIFQKRYGYKGERAAFRVYIAYRNERAKSAQSANSDQLSLEIGEGDHE